jgi:hypothetical protein
VAPKNTSASAVAPFMGRFLSSGFIQFDESRGWNDSVRSGRDAVHPGLRNRHALHETVWPYL